MNFKKRSIFIEQSPIVGGVDGENVGLWGWGCNRKTVVAGEMGHVLV